MTVDIEQLKRQLDLRREALVRFTALYYQQGEFSFSCAEGKHPGHPPAAPVSGQAKPPLRNQALRSANDCEQADVHTDQHPDARSHGGISPEAPDMT